MGVPQSCPGWGGGYFSPVLAEVPLRQDLGPPPPSQGWVPPRKDMDQILGYPPRNDMGPKAGLTPPQERTWYLRPGKEPGTRVLPTPEQADTCENMTSRRTTYARTWVLPPPSQGWVPPRKDMGPDPGVPPQKWHGTKGWTNPPPQERTWYLRPGKEPGTRGTPHTWPGRHLWKHDLPSYYIRRR